METSRLNYLFNQYVNDSATQVEEFEFFEWVTQNENSIILEELLSKKWESFESRNKLFSEKRKEIMLSEIYERTKSSGNTLIIKPYKRYFVIAAIFCLVTFSIGLIIWQVKPSDHDLSVSQTNPPGKSSAMLTLSNGKVIKLNDLTSGVLKDEVGISIITSSNGEVIYKINESNVDPQKTNTLSTSNGEMYRLKLADGTNVWLNASSSITFSPSLIHKGSRTVILKGEGYFEVSKDKRHPFIVRTGQQDIEVLGTKFDINAYEDSGKIRTTLLEGSVKISTKQNREAEIKPGQQAILLANGALSISEVDTEQAVAWKDGNFMFDNENLENIMNNIGRWYNVEIIYQNEEIKKYTFWGTVSRFSNVVDVLKILERTGKIHFKIIDRKIYISK